MDIVSIRDLIFCALVHWVNAVNENIISASKWDFIDKIGWDNNSQIADEEGCMALEFSWHQSSLTVRSLIKHVSCDPTTTTPVKSYLCEKAEEGTLSKSVHLNTKLDYLGICITLYIYIYYIFISNTVCLPLNQGVPCLKLI